MIFEIMFGIFPNIIPSTEYFLFRIKYLGSLSQRVGSCQPEVRARIESAEKHWRVFSGYFTSDSAYFGRKLVFVALMLNSIVAGMEAKTPTSSEYNQLFSYLAKQMQKMASTILFFVLLVFGTPLAKHCYLFRHCNAWELVLGTPHP